MLILKTYKSGKFDPGMTEMHLDKNNYLKECETNIKTWRLCLLKKILIPITRSPDALSPDHQNCKRIISHQCCVPCSKESHVKL